MWCRRVQLLVACAVVLMVASFVGCRPQRSLVIGSKSFPESRLLASMFAILAEDAGIPVEQRTSLGGTLVAFNALLTGEVDVYPEYTGTGYIEILKRKGSTDSQRVLAEVREEFARRWHLRWLDPLGFDNSYALAMRSETAERLGLRTLSHLAAQSKGLVFGSSHEFLARQDGYIGLRALYGIDFGEVRAMQHGLAYEALRESRVDVVDVYSTDGKLYGANLRVLQDDRHFFPPYQAAPLVREEALARFPRLRSVLESLRDRLDDREMQRLNHEVETRRRDFGAVALEFLRSQGLTLRTEDREERSRGFWWFLWERRSTTLAEVAQHLKLTGIAMLLAVLAGVPLGIGISRRPALAGPVLGVASVLQTIPSIALLAFMLPYLGLGERPAIAALFLYALLPILRNTCTGIRGVDPALVEVGTGMGLKPRQVLMLVELPLAIPVIMAGVRTAAVISIGTATLAAFIGAGGLGDPIVTGLTLNDENLILSGALPAAALAIVVDLALGLVERLVTPRGLSGA